MSGSAGRRVLHTLSAGILLPSFWGWDVVRMVLAGLVVAGAAAEYVRLSHPGFRRRLGELVPVFRPREATRPTGAWWLVAGYTLAALLPPASAAVGIMVGAFADPAASWAGERWGGDARKSWVGTMAAVAVGTVAAALAGAVFSIRGVSVPVAIAVGLAAGALERWSGPLDDNLLLAPGAGLAVLLFA